MPGRLIGENRYSCTHSYSWHYVTGNTEPHNLAALLTLNRKLSEPQSQSGCYAGEKTLLLLSGLNPTSSAIMTTAQSLYSSNFSHNLKFKI
jgi:hypothetical protein